VVVTSGLEEVTGLDVVVAGLDEVVAGLIEVVVVVVEVGVPNKLGASDGVTGAVTGI
jgi:hypothetical protein